MDDLMLKQLANKGIYAAVGAPLVENALKNLSYDGPVYILAVGKAAGSMLSGAQSTLSKFEHAIMVTKVDHIGDFYFCNATEIYESGHPIPNETSLVAGNRILQWVSALPANANLILLLSGGASSLVEVLHDGWTLKDLQSTTQQLLASGADIETINQNRKGLSLIKGGRLLEQFKGKRADVLCISDVEGNNLSCIGSGLGAAPYRFQFQYSSAILASNKTTRETIAQHAKSFNLPVIVNEESLYDDVEILAANLVKQVISGPSGLYIFGGESTVRLPRSPGKGGRNQLLGLLFARELKRHPLQDVQGLFLGTDGTDGPTEYAGAYVNSNTLEELYEADLAIQTADPTTFLKQKDACVYLGPTGTNVMDIALIKKN